MSGHVFELWGLAWSCRAKAVTSCSTLERVESSTDLRELLQETSGNHARFCVQFFTVSIDLRKYMSLFVHVFALYKM